MKAVPEAYLGVWQRTLLTTTGGVRDSSTAVYWLQTAQLFADLRIPQPLAAGAAGLALQAGFAGVTEVIADRCQWHRAIDFQPPRGSEDIGLMRFESPGYLLEDGLDGSYHEVWERLPESIGRNWGTWLVADDGRQGCLLLAGDCFLFAASRGQALPAAESLSALLDADNVASLLAFELSFGRHQGGATPWRIELSTLAGRAGQVLLPATLDPDGLERALTPALLATLGAEPPLSGWRQRDWPTFAEELNP